MSCVSLSPGCGAPLETISEPCTLDVRSGRTREFVLAREVAVSLVTGFGKVLKRGSHWRSVGTIPAGEVYRPVDAVFTYPAKWQHEAYLVISDGSLVGFYFPVERVYVEQKPSQVLPMRKDESA